MPSVTTTVPKETTIKEETETTAPTETTVPTETTQPKGEGVPFSDIMNLGLPQGYVISYDITATVEGKENTMQYTQYVKGEKSRTDTEGIFEGQEMEMRFYSLPKGGYSCTKLQGEWSCFGGKTREEFKETTGTSTGEEQQETFEEKAPKVTYDGTQTIVGVTAPCYKVSYKGGESRMCVHPDHYLPLLIQAKDFEMIATSLSLTPPEESAFELPAEPIYLGDLPVDIPGMP